MSDLKKIKDEFLTKLKGKLNLSEINQIKSDLFGKNGLVSLQFKKIGAIAESERKKFASDLNQLKDELQNLISKKIDDIETKEINQKLEKEFFLSGGLDIYNLGIALKNNITSFFDVSSSVESSPGVKDKAKIKEFIGKVKDIWQLKKSKTH